MLQYDYKLTYKQGITHTNVDALSRREYTTSLEEQSPNCVDDADITTSSNSVHSIAENSTVISNMNEPSQQITNLAHNGDSYSLNMDDVIQLQRADPDYRDSILYLEDNVLPIDIEQRRIACMESAMYSISDRALYRVHIREGKGGNAQRTVLQLAIPKQLILLILQNMHDSPVSGGHMGIARTVDKVRERYFFTKMCALITQYVKTYEICCQRNNLSNKLEQQ